MMAFLEFTFRDGWHFAGVFLLIVLVGVILDSIVEKIVKGVRA